MTDYKIEVYDTSGDRKFTITDFLDISYVKRVNRPGLLSFLVDGGHNVLGNVSKDWHLEAWRKAKNQDWSREIIGLHKYIMWEMPAGERQARLVGPGLLNMLKDRIVAWTAGYSDRSKFVSEKAETIANTLVKYNATSDATTGNGRERAGAITGLTVEADGLSGNTEDWFCAYDELLDSLRALAKIGGGDFDIVKTSQTAWQWRWYENQLGTDRTASVIFSLDRSNMANPAYKEDALEEKTVAIVAGQGTESDREIQIETSDDYVVTTNDREIFVPAPNITTTAGLTSRGEDALAGRKQIREFYFDVVQTEGTKYGKDYYLGDLVTAINPFSGASYTMKVLSVTVSAESGGKEKIEIGMSEPL